MELPAYAIPKARMIEHDRPYCFVRFSRLFRVKIPTHTSAVPASNRRIGSGASWNAWVENGESRSIAKIVTPIIAATRIATAVPLCVLEEVLQLEVMIGWCECDGTQLLVLQDSEESRSFSPPRSPHSAYVLDRLTSPRPGARALGRHRRMSRRLEC